MPKIVITAVYAFEPAMYHYPGCSTIEDVRDHLQTGNNAEREILYLLRGFFGVLDCKVEIDRSDEG